MSIQGAFLLRMDQPSTNNAVTGLSCLLDTPSTELTMSLSSRSVTRAAGLSSGGLAPADDFGAAELLLERPEDSTIFAKGPCVKHMRFFRDLEAAAF